MEDEDLIRANTSREWPYLSCLELVAKPLYLYMYVHVNFLVCILLCMQKILVIKYVQTNDFEIICVIPYINICQVIMRY